GPLRHHLGPDRRRHRLLHLGPGVFEGAGAVQPADRRHPGGAAEAGRHGPPHHPGAVAEPAAGPAQGRRHDEAGAGVPGQVEQRAHGPGHRPRGPRHPRRRRHHHRASAHPPRPEPGVGDHLRGHRNRAPAGDRSRGHRHQRVLTAMRPSHRGCGPASARLVCGWLAPLLLLWAAAVAAAELPEGLSKAPVPAWVTPMPDPPPAEPGGGLRYRLVDLQLSLLDGEPQEYNDFRFDVVHRDGLEKAGRWSIQYQPRFHRVLLHHLRVVRNGRAADRLSDARIELLRPESRAGDGIYTGWRTAEILIPDVQVGDRIEIAYTLAGSNPVLGGLVHRSYTAAYSQAVGLRQVRVLAPAERPLRWRRSGPIEYEVSDRQHGGIRELVLQARPLPGIRHEGGSPGWFDGYGEIEVSNARDWAEVVAWSARLFRHQDSRAALRRLAGELSLAGRPEAEALTAALDYVQREVRYVSLSIG